MAKPRRKKPELSNAPPSGSMSNKLANKADARNPKSMVIRMGAGDVGPSISQLVTDVRTMMEPDTASRLKERKSNKLRDYTTMAGPLGVTHLLLFSRSKNGNTNMRLAVTPRGPTLHFRVEEYSLCKDVHKSQKRPKSGANAGFGGKEGLTAPLLVMNNFVTQPQQSDEKAKSEQQKQHIPKHLESLTTTVFQSLFPAINPTTTPLKNIKRVLLLDRASQSTSAPTDDQAYILDLRHYAIETRTAKSVPKPLRRLDAATEKLAHAGQKRKRGNLPNLGRLDDVADYLLDPHAADGYTSGSDSEPETDAEVEILAPTTQKLQNRDRKKSQTGKENGHHDQDAQQSRVEKKGVKLQELGPRLRLRMTKVEEGLCTGKVMWHDYIKKTAAEEKELERSHAEKTAEKERRRAEQKARVEAKKKAKGGQANGAEDDEEESDEDMDDEGWSGIDEDEMEGGSNEEEGDEDEEAEVEADDFD